MAPVSLLLALLALPQAAARVFPTPIIVEDEQDLLELVADATLAEDDYETLVELLSTPLDINRARAGELVDLPGVDDGLARAIVRDRKARGPFGDVTDLLRVPGASDDLLAQVYPFVEAAPPPAKGKPPLKGQVRFRSAMEFKPVEPIEGDHPHKTHDARQLGYGQVPNSYLTARVKYHRWLNAGFLGLAQDGISAAAYDPGSHDIYATWRAPQLEFGKLYVQAERLRWEAIAGSYTAGFGLGLGFDTTSRTHPGGLYPDLTVSGTDHFSARKGLFGAGGSLLAVPLGESASLDATLFASSWTYDIYQYDLGVAGSAEPVDPFLVETDSPRIYVKTPDGAWERGGYLTLPNAYRESLAGANAVLRFLDSGELGITGYVGALDTTVLPGVEQPYDLILRSGFPVEHTYGAASVYGATQFGLLDLKAEAAHSFTGGQAYLLKGVLDVSMGEIEGTLRRYDTDFDNPHARGLANADEYAGMRDRDEQGARLKAKLEPVDWLSARLLGDVWQRMSTGVWSSELYGRVALVPSGVWSVAAFGDHKNRDLANNGRSRDYGGDWTLDEDADLGDIDYEESLDGVIEGAGSKWYWGAQANTTVIPRVGLTALYKRTYTDSAYLYPDPQAYCDYWFQVGHYAWAKLRVDPFDKTSLTLRGKYEDEDVYGDQGARYVEAYAQASQAFPHKIKVGLRGTIEHDMDDPRSAFEAPCASAGAPDLCDSCVCDESAGVDDTLATELKTTGLVQLTVEWRF